LIEGSGGERRGKMKTERARLYFMCGKMAVGKSTFARALARERSAVLLDQDEFLDALYPGEIRTIQDFTRYSARLRDGLSRHVRDLLSRGVSVVLDFPGNTRAQRRWFRELFEGASVEHELHFIDAPDDLCKRQLRQRSQGLPAGSAWATDAEFDAVTAYFQAPAADEKFNVIRHERA
jgi:predicted kinase